jgi:hypothetical protein
MVKDEDGTVTVSLYEDLPAEATPTVETPAPVEKKEADIKTPAEITTTNTTEQSKEEEKKTETAAKK